MYNAFLQRTEQTIQALVKHVRTSERFRTALFDDALKCEGGKPAFDPLLASTENAPDRVEWRIIDHCAAVTRIYAIYEQFVHEMVREHLSLLQSRLLFSELPEKMQSAYRLGLAKILERKDGPRFGDLDLAQLVENYHRGLKGEPYTLEPRALLTHEQNLRLSELDRLTKACGIEGVGAWIENHRCVKEFLSSEERLSSTAESELLEIVKYRNDAAHGSIDIGSILSVNVLVEFCEFISALCEALSECVQLAGLEILERHGHVHERGAVTEYFRKGMVVVAEITGAFKEGGTIYLCGENYCLERSLVSLQLDDVAISEVNCEVPTALGMGFDAPARDNARIKTFQLPEAPIEPISSI